MIEDQITYQNLLNEKELIKLRLKAEKSYLNKQYLKEHEKTFRWLNILFVLMIIFNIGALIFTNMLVIHNNPSKVLFESNPVTAKINNYITNKNANIMYFGFIFHILIWIILISYFVIQRKNIISNWDLNIYIIWVISGFVIISFDFFNNFGFIMGKVLWG